MSWNEWQVPPISLYLHCAQLWVPGTMLLGPHRLLTLTSAMRCTVPADRLAIMLSLVWLLEYLFLKLSRAFVLNVLRHCVDVLQGIYPCNKLVPNPTVVHATLSLVTARFLHVVVH